MSMGLCADCRWWKPQDNEVWGDCIIGEWDASRAEDGPNATKPDTLAHAAAGDHDASLCTGATFGCVQFEGRAS